MIFIKLGGALVTDKSKPFTMNWPVLDLVLDDLAKIDEVMVVGHGGGSFGHFVALEYKGLKEGFFKIKEAMAKLNLYIVSAMIAKGIPAVGFPPSAFMLAKGGKPYRTFHHSIMHATNDYVPVVHGDAVVDLEEGYTIFSTERVFMELSKHIKPRKVLLASKTPVMMDGEPVREIGDWNLLDVLEATGGAEKDVTGGMRAKVLEGAHMSAATGANVYIFDGSKKGSIYRAWKYGEGTRISVTKIPKTVTK